MSKLKDKNPRSSLLSKLKAQKAQKEEDGTDYVSVRPYFVETFAETFDAQVKWESRSVSLTNPQTGDKVFEADDLVFPDTWSDNCTALVAEKYFRVVSPPDGGDAYKETSVEQMISRVAGTIARWGYELDYFTESTMQDFEGELEHILVNQMAAFNSPVWFNIGTNGGKHRTEQASACFILSLDDTMESILELSKTEGKLYKGGSGSGVNYSNLRSSRESLSKGGTASGPVPFIAKDDANAGAVKSGGGTRRAAKICLLDVDHGDIFEFIQTKINSEKAAHALIDSGVFDGDFRARWGAYQMVPFQNANHSVRVTDEFIRAVKHEEDWDLLARDGEVLDTVPAKKIWDAICEAAWFCGDPGLQFDTTINAWHTSPSTGLINSSNPCSEYMYLDDSACNLASINLLKFYDKNEKEFKLEELKHTIDVLILAQEILVEGAKYPTEAIELNSHEYRPLGLGFSNLGGLLLAQGIPYDSVEGREQAALLTALISGRGYQQSANIAEIMGPFPGYDLTNKAVMDTVMLKHYNALGLVKGPEKRRTDTTELASAAHNAWGAAIALGRKFGYRNGQISVIAPAGTISFMMDCDTTGIEPDLSLKKTKKLVGGSSIQIVNQRVIDALRSLDYSETQVYDILKYVDEHGSVVGASHLRAEHLTVFDTSLADPVGGRSIPAKAHVLMMAAVQPFVSGAISKTVNMPREATVKDISDIYMLAHEVGLKSIALYRDGCKRTQPLSTQTSEEVESDTAPTPLRLRKKLPRVTKSARQQFEIGGHSGYLHAGYYPDGKIGELFVRMAKEGSTISGLIDAVGVLTSIALQYGVPLDVLVDKFSYTKFEPSGITNDESVRFASSPLDYIFRALANLQGSDTSEVDEPVVDVSPTANKPEGSLCDVCGNELQRAGACLSCSTCGYSGGCG